MQEATFCAWRIAKIDLATATSARSSEDSNLAGNHSILPQLVVALLAIIVGDDLGFFCGYELGSPIGAGRQNSHRHEMWVRFYPGERLLFGVKKTIDDDGIALSRISSARARSFAIDHIWSTVYGHAWRIGKDNFTAIGNSLWIDGAMPFAQLCTVPRRVLARTFPMPVNRNACQR